MRNWVLSGAISLLIAGPACAAPPVTITDKNGNQAAVVGTALSVTLSGGGGGSALVVAPDGVTTTDASGTITTGGSYQTFAAASGTRLGCFIQNPSTATEPLLVKFATMANPITLTPGQPVNCESGVTVDQSAITISAATTGHAFAGGVQ